MSNIEGGLDLSGHEKPREIEASWAERVGKIGNIFRVQAPEVGQIRGSALEHPAKPGWLMMSANHKGKNVLVIFQDPEY